MYYKEEKLILLKKPHKCKYCKRLIIWKGWESENGCFWCDDKHPVYIERDKKILDNIDINKIGEQHDR